MMSTGSVWELSGEVATRRSDTTAMCMWVVSEVVSLPYLPRSEGKGRRLGSRGLGEGESSQRSPGWEGSMAATSAAWLGLATWKCIVDWVPPRSGRITIAVFLDKWEQPKMGLTGTATEQILPKVKLTLRGTVLSQDSAGSEFQEIILLKIRRTRA